MKRTVILALVTAVLLTSAVSALAADRTVLAELFGATW